MSYKVVVMAAPTGIPEVDGTTGNSGAFGAAVAAEGGDGGAGEEEEKAAEEEEDDDDDEEDEEEEGAEAMKKETKKKKEKKKKKETVKKEGANRFTVQRRGTLVERDFDELLFAVVRTMRRHMSSSALSMAAIFPPLVTEGPLKNSKKKGNGYVCRVGCV